MKRQPGSTLSLALTLVLAPILALAPAPLAACTLWAAVGPAADGGTLVAKNRDWRPDHKQMLELVRPRYGLAYFGLFAVGSDEPGLKGGVNEKGLAIISASTNIPKRLRADQSGKHGVMRQILQYYASVADLAADAGKVFSQARDSFFLVSDRKQVLVVEVGLDGHFSAHPVDAGTTAHTNHFLDPQLAALYNEKIGASSATRLARINELLAQGQPPFTLDQFAAMSRDRHDGPDDSLWRNGKEWTLASWILESRAAGPQSLRVVIANPGEAERTQTFTLDQAFWKR